MISSTMMAILPPTSPTTVRGGFSLGFCRLLPPFRHVLPHTWTSYVPLLILQSAKWLKMAQKLVENRNFAFFEPFRAICRVPHVPEYALVQVCPSPTPSPHLHGEEFEGGHT